ncbi:MAG: anaerobic ribonucleoside-triphosphate reductase activating protein, partial [Gammaproteobacteria bacterium]
MKKTPATNNDIVVGGLTPLTTIDYPGELSAVIFLQGCPWRCGYCHNGHLLPRADQQDLSWEQIVAFLEDRRGLLDAVVFSGGEPTLQKGLSEAIREVKEMGFKIGLHTAGIYPERFQALLPLLDWVGLDIKASMSDYEKITGVPGSGKRAWQSAEILIKSGVDHEIRTTVHPDLIDEQALIQLTMELGELGVRNYCLQECITHHCLDVKLHNTFSNITASSFLTPLSQMISG